MEEKPNYYAILPANIRYSKKLRANEKLMYSEITALSQKNGECWASNNYFASLFETSPQAISKWIKDLEKEGFIEISYETEGKQITKRIIKLVSTNIDTYQQMFKGGINKCLRGYQQMIKENNTSDNNTSINIYSKHKYGEYKNVLLTDEELGKLKEEFPSDWSYWIEKVSIYVASTGKSYKNYLATIRNWAKKETRKEEKIIYKGVTSDEPLPYL